MKTFGSHRLSLVALSLLTLLALAVAPVAAHEHRAVGPKGEYTLIVGWFYEPAYEGVVNAVDIRVLRTADNKPVNASKGDVVNLEVDVELRAADSDKAAVLESSKINDKPEITFGTENRYAAWFKPVRAGAYAFRIKGTISDASKPTAGSVTIDELFICGKGSKAGHAFVCLETPQAFPTK
jgi:hypothetical protein